MIKQECRGGWWPSSRLSGPITAILFGLLSAVVLWQGIEIHRLNNVQSLRLQRLDIVDAKGASRLILAAPLPDPMVLGKEHKRGAAVSGLAIADATGTERGGYVTSDEADANALLTLDGQGHQTFLVLAEKDGNTLLRVWNGDHGSVMMGVSNAPFLNQKQGSQTLFSSPPNNPESRDPRPLFK